MAKKITKPASVFAKALLLATLLPAVAWAHTPICDCYDNGDMTVTCEGGFSDGGSAAGVTMRVVNQAGKVLIQGVMSEYSDYTFDLPDGNFRVLYEAGEGHVIEIDSRDIEE